MMGDKGEEEEDTTLERSFSAQEGMKDLVTKKMQIRHAKWFKNMRLSPGKMNVDYKSYHE